MLDVIMIGTMDRKEALLYIVKYPCGNIETLRKKIGDPLVKEFEYMGYIRNGVSSTEKTYKSTRTAIEDYNTFFVDTPWYSALPSVLFALFAKL